MGGAQPHLQPVTRPLPVVAAAPRGGHIAERLCGIAGGVNATAGASALSSWRPWRCLGPHAAGCEVDCRTYVTFLHHAPSHRPIYVAIRGHLMDVSNPLCMHACTETHTLNLTRGTPWGAIAQPHAKRMGTSSKSKGFFWSAGHQLERLNRQTASEASTQGVCIIFPAMFLSVECCKAACCVDSVMYAEKHRDTRAEPRNHNAVTPRCCFAASGRCCLWVLHPFKIETVPLERYTNRKVSIARPQPRLTPRFSLLQVATVCTYFTPSKSKRFLWSAISIERCSLLQVVAVCGYLTGWQCHIGAKVVSGAVSGG